MGSQHPPSSSSSAFQSPDRRSLCLWCRLLPGNAWPWQPAVAGPWRIPSASEGLLTDHRVPCLQLRWARDSWLKGSSLMAPCSSATPPWIGGTCVRKPKIPLLPLMSIYIPPWARRDSSGGAPTPFIPSSVAPLVCPSTAQLRAVIQLPRCSKPWGRARVMLELECFSVRPGHTHMDTWPELGAPCSVSKSQKDPGSWMCGQQREVVSSTPAPSLGSQRQRTGGTPKHKTLRYLGCPPQPGGDMYLGSLPKRSRFWCALSEMVSG